MATTFQPSDDMSLKVRLQEQEDRIASLEKELKESQDYNSHLLEEIEKLRANLEQSEGAWIE